MVAQDAATGGDQTDFEAELGFILAKPIRDVTAQQAMESVLGYCCANDVSARWWQKQGSGGQFWRGKSFDTFCPIGPWIDTDAPYEGIAVRCTVDDKVRQDGNTNDLIFDVPTLISYVSHVMTLLPGDVILTGTPEGVGPLVAGDTVTVSVQGVGDLTNPVVADEA